VPIPSGGIFDYDVKKEELEEVLRELEDPAVWNDPEKAQKLGQRRATLQETIDVLDALDSGLVDASDLLDMAREEDDEDTVDAVAADLASLDGVSSKISKPN